jgi:hypothetical protein
MTPNWHLFTREELIEAAEGYRAAAMAFERALNTKTSQLMESERLSELRAQRIDYLHDEIAKRLGRTA